MPKSTALYHASKQRWMSALSAYQNNRLAQRSGFLYALTFQPAKQQYTP